MSNLYRGHSIDVSYQGSVHLASGFRGEFFLKLANQKQELPVAAVFVNGSELNEHLYRGPSKDASYQVLIHLARRFRGEDFLEINQSETQMACGGHVC